MGVATTFAITHRGIDGKPVPSRHADLSELIALGDVLNEMGKGVVQVTPGKQLPITDIYDFQRRIGRPVTYGALLTMPNGMWRDNAELNNVEPGPGRRERVAAGHPPAARVLDGRCPTRSP